MEYSGMEEGVTFIAVESDEEESIGNWVKQDARRNNSDNESVSIGGWIEEELGGSDRMQGGQSENANVPME